MAASRRTSGQRRSRRHSAYVGELQRRPLVRKALRKKLEREWKAVLADDAARARQRLVADLRSVAARAVAYDTEQSRSLVRAAEALAAQLDEPLERRFVAWASVLADDHLIADVMYGELADSEQLKLDRVRKHRQAAKDAGLYVGGRPPTPGNVRELRALGDDKHVDIAMDLIVQADLESLS